MKLFFGANIQGVTTLMELMKCLIDKGEVGHKVVNSIVYDNEFTLTWLNTLSLLYPDKTIIGNSFIQDSVLKKLQNIELFIFKSDSKDEYETGNRYVPLYNYLKKHKIKVNLVIDEKTIPGLQVIDLQSLLWSTLIIWRETHMGTITDAINRALQEVQEVEVEESFPGLDTIKQSMANIGMSVEGYKKDDSNPTEDFMNQPEDSEECLEDKDESSFKESENEENEELGEICVKISGNNMILFIPTGTKMDSVTVGGVDFNTISAIIPDLSNSGMQVLQVISNRAEDVKATSKPAIVKRVPIISNREPYEPYEPYKDSLDSLKKQKSELDAKIKEARDNGDSELVNELRKQRRKLRAKINELG